VSYNKILTYQVKVWGDYSVQIEDYVKLGIPQDKQPQMFDIQSHNQKQTTSNQKLELIIIVI